MQTYDHGTFLIVLDCDDLERAANFWCDALGYDMPYPQSGPYLQLVAEHRGGVELLLQQTPDPKLPRIGCTSTSARRTSTSKCSA